MHATSTPTKPQINPITHRDRATAAAVLHRAFTGYPLVNYMFENSKPEQWTSFTSMFEALIESRLVRNWPVLGAWRGRHLVGVAVVSRPDDAPSTPAADAEFEAAERAIGADASGRFRAYADVCDAGLPKWPHHYLGILGVDPAHRGQHHGRALIEAVKTIARNDPNSKGVVLNTEARGNLAYYEGSGFRKIHAERLDVMTTWTMAWQP